MESDSIAVQDFREQHTDYGAGPSIVGLDVLLTCLQLIQESTDLSIQTRIQTEFSVLVSS